eukprot:CAMPEP_0194317562 /NCGR_PEP_ID=MMETSP0171-20130528/14311_1 /TAXON_ID=218684 /ORGANISM="Corethron pennatum, Strain L29A3" /LENGTH=129 /DNA_ID=CAMNT_0039074221 /DNA_START=217 /DNA_END=602 /DNA_ORIENTATION=-
MKVTVKTLKGGKFVIDVVGGNDGADASIGEVKKIIEIANPELPAANMKLIKSGKILKDTDTVGSAGIAGPTDFLVCMIAKVKKPPTPAPPAPAPPPAAPVAAPAASVAAPAAPAAPAAAPAAATTSAAP